MDRVCGTCRRIPDITQARIGAKGRRSPSRPHDPLRRCNLRLARTKRRRLRSNRCRPKLREGKWPRPTFPNSEIDNRRDRYCRGRGNSNCHRITVGNEIFAEGVDGRFPGMIVFTPTRSHSLLVRWSRRNHGILFAWIFIPSSICTNDSSSNRGVGRCDEVSGIWSRF